MEINKNGYTYHIERYGIESDDMLIKRGWFVANQLQNNEGVISEAEFEKAVQYSIIWQNIKVHKCKYNDKITKEIEEICENYMC